MSASITPTKTPHTERLMGFVVHMRPYQEKRAIYTFFTQEGGLVDGVGKRGLPLFVPIQLLSVGKSALKTFKDPFLMTDTGIFAHKLPWSLQCAALYLNELLYRLLPKNDPQAMLWQAYQQTLALFFVGCDDFVLRCVLRRFEWRLFVALGVPFSWTIDGNGAHIKAGERYVFCGERGFVPSMGDDAWQFAQLVQLQSIQQALDAPLHQIDFMHIPSADIQALGRIFRQMVDGLLDFRPLHSRTLWRDHGRFVQKTALLH